METLQVLGRDECYSLLAAGSLGRVAFTQNALPAIRPVSYALLGNHVVLQTETHGLGRRLDGQVVAFEVDDIDLESGSGWSVVLVGPARLLHQPGELVNQDYSAVFPFAGPGRSATVSIGPGELTGRRISTERGS